MPNQPTKPIDVFFSYAHEDEELRRKLENHLSSLRHEGIIRSWHDRDIKAGDEWKKKIDEHLETASIILLLISADFLASNYCYDIEMKRAIARHDAGEARVIPIILRPVDWQVTLFGKLQALPKDGKAVTAWANRDEAFQNIAAGIRRVVAESAEPKPPIKVQQLDEKGWTSLLRAIKEKECTPFLGPDVRSGGLALRAKIAQNWAEQHDYPLKDSRDLARVSRDLSAVKFDLDQVKRDLIEMLKGAPGMGFPTPDFANPLEPHIVLARLGLPVYVCADYEDYMWQALARHPGRTPRREFCRWRRSLEDLASFLPEGFNPNEANPLVFHLYGYLEKLDGTPPDTAESLVVTEDDYLEYLIYVSKERPLPLRIEKAMSNTSLLLLGYRLDDWDFRTLFHLLLANPLNLKRDRTHVAVQLAPVDEEAPEEQRKKVEDYLRRYVSDKAHIRVYVGACQDFIAELNERLLGGEP
ncbi:MAG: TIR domain-containing protein [Acidobacteria bacterium]|nr:TIR domain-containing protein [Acidobacteriota bacterium]